jgi:hypothetical protein
MPFQRSVCTNPTSGGRIAKFSINRQPDGVCDRDNFSLQRLLDLLPALATF